jgi:quercetin dioxygenase-like cupin family protein
MNGRTIAVGVIVAALAATSGVALALNGHSESAQLTAATSAPVTAVTPAPTPAPPVHATVGKFHFSGKNFSIDSDKSTEVVMPKITIHAGASSGWHAHPGPGFVVVTSGTLVLYQAIDNRCVKSTYAPGQGFVETPGVVHIARNESASGDVIAQATFLDIAAGSTAYKSIVPAPAACPGIK